MYRSIFAEAWSGVMMVMIFSRCANKLKKTISELTNEVNSWRVCKMRRLQISFVEPLLWKGNFSQLVFTLQ